METGDSGSTGLKHHGHHHSKDEHIHFKEEDVKGHEDDHVIHEADTKFVVSKNLTIETGRVRRGRRSGT